MFICTLFLRKIDTHTIQEATETALFLNIFYEE